MAGATVAGGTVAGGTVAGGGAGGGGVGRGVVVAGGRVVGVCRRGVDAVEAGFTDVVADVVAGAGVGDE